ncbi:MAG TPA: LamG domain-containing protein, partial [Roseimicrobium sp.]|nr:LamG domain-containing protein [Roseimicrobium sp.]
MNSQAYGVSCVGRTRSNGVSQIKRNVTISNNLFNGFQRGAVYIGLDWGEAVQNGTVMENFTITGNDVIITRQWEGNEGVFITRTGRINRNLVWSDNTVTFLEKPVSAPIFFNMIRMPFASFEGGAFVNNLVTFDTSLAVSPPRFGALLQIGGTRDFLVSGNTFDVGGYFFLWRGGENVVVEDNIFKNVQRLVRAENIGRFSFVGNDIEMSPSYLAELFYLYADNWLGGDLTVANNRITLPPTGTADLIDFDFKNSGQFKNVAALNNNILTGGSRPFYSGTHPIVRTLPGAANWTFDEGFGTTAGDGSTNQNHLTLNNGATWVEGARELALSVDGIDDYASIPNPGSLNFTSDFSISAWVYMTGGGSTRGIVSKITNNAWYQYFLSVYNGKLTFQQKYSGGDSRYSAGTVPSNRWVHVAATISSTQLVTLYVDGKQTGTYQSTVIPAVDTTSVNVGRRGGSTPDYYFMGRIDEVQINSGVLSAGDVQRIAFGRALGYWRMEENTGTTLGDESGLNNPGTVMNGAAWTTGVAGGKALQFDGIDDYVNVGSPSALNTLGTFTMTAWIYSTTTDSSVRTILSKNQ